MKKLFFMTIILLLVTTPIFAFDDWKENRQNPKSVIIVPDGAINSQTGDFYPKSGKGIVNPQTGDYYPESGPKGYVNPKTWEFIEKD